MPCMTRSSPPIAASAPTASATRSPLPQVLTITAADSGAIDPCLPALAPEKRIPPSATTPPHPRNAGRQRRDRPLLDPPSSGVMRCDGAPDDGDADRPVHHVRKPGTNGRHDVGAIAVVDRQREARSISIEVAICGESVAAPGGRIPVELRDARLRQTLCLESACRESRL
jgi:hypothetical protein